MPTRNYRHEGNFDAMSNAETFSSALLHLASCQWPVGQSAFLPHFFLHLASLPVASWPVAFLMITSHRNAAYSSMRQNTRESS